MAQAGYTPIQLYYSTTASAAPSSGNLANGELAINITDGKLYYKDNGGTVRVLAGTGGTGVVAGSNTQVQFNNNGVFGASSGLTWDGTYLTANSIKDSALTSGRVTFAGASGLLSDAAGLTWDGTNFTANSIKDSALTSGRVTYAGTSGLLQDSANLTFDGTKLTVAGLKDSALTSGRVPYATTSGELIDSANLLYSGTDLTVYGITVGRGAGAVSTNTAVGASALVANTTGAYTTAIGWNALNANTTGGGAPNSAFGYNSLALNTTGGFNLAAGGNTLYSNTTGNYNTALGLQALYSNTTASYNTAIGYQAAYSNTSNNNGVTAVGYRAAYSNSNGYATALGNRAGESYNASGETYGSTFIGASAGLATTTGVNNVTVGEYSLRSNTSGSQNVAVGAAALYSNTTASSNTAVGYQAGYGITTGEWNTVIGDQAGYSLGAGSYNVFVGKGAGYSSTGASGRNTFIGMNAGQQVTTGVKNTILGRYNGNEGGLDIRTQSNFVVLSDGDGDPVFYVVPSGVNGGINGRYFSAAQTLGSSTNLNDIFKTGMYRVDSGASNTPTTNYYALIVYGNGGNVTTQIATVIAGTTTYVRSYNTSWSAWVAL